MTNTLTYQQNVQQLRKGDMFYTSWGYDQTNYDYIVVLGVSKTGKTALCQRTGALHMGHTDQQNAQEPVFCPFGDTFTMRIKPNCCRADEVNLRGSYPFTHDGSMKHNRLDTFWPVEPGKLYFETDSMSGH